MTKLWSNFFLFNLFIYTVILNDVEFIINRDTTNVKILHDYVQDTKTVQVLRMCLLRDKGNKGARACVYFFNLISSSFQMAFYKSL